MSLPLDWLVAAVVGLGALAVGVCAHELLHVVPLRLLGADYTVTLLPGEASTETPALAALPDALSGGLVRVEVTDLPPDAPEWAVRVAAALPVVLALPLVLAAAGVLPDPTATGDRVGTALLVAAGASGLPSPADWSVVWHGAAGYRASGADPSE
ncbi:hypothetical protein [Halorussus marinus]|uniref:hypothetical protein n=1 Tax=Halorussus marinus TaxID=2505976 RepID=UPI00106E27F6|nr:hypothetical protein [Halorussus marinus]